MRYVVCMAAKKTTTKGASKTKASEPVADEPRTGTVPANFRLPAALVDALDSWADDMNQQNPMGRRWTRTDVVQEALARAVQERKARGESP